MRAEPVRPRHTLFRESLNWRTPSVLSFHLGGQGTPRMRWKEDGRSQRVWRTSGKYGPPKKVSRAHVGSQRWKQQEWNLHGSAPTRSSSNMTISSLLFGDSWQRHWVCLWLFWCSFAFLGGCLVQPPYESFHLAVLYLVFSCLAFFSWRPTHF